MTRRTSNVIDGGINAIDILVGARDEVVDEFLYRQIGNNQLHARPDVPLDRQKSEIEEQRDEVVALRQLPRLKGVLDPRRAALLGNDLLESMIVAVDAAIDRHKIADLRVIRAQILVDELGRNVLLLKKILHEGKDERRIANLGSDPSLDVRIGRKPVVVIPRNKRTKHGLLVKWESGGLTIVREHRPKIVTRELVDSIRAVVVETVLNKPDLLFNAGEVEVEDEVLAVFRRRIVVDGEPAEKLVEARGVMDVVVALEHRDEERLAEPPRTEEHHIARLLQLADVRRAVDVVRPLRPHADEIRHTVENWLRVRHVRIIS